jgi:hypothetical protein
MLIVVILSVVMLDVVKLSASMQNVVASSHQQYFFDHNKQKERKFPFKKDEKMKIFFHYSS